MQASEKRKLDLEVKPMVALAQKMQVMQQDLKNRPHWQEVAEVFEEILVATEQGLSSLPPRRNRAPGQVENEIKLQKAQKEQEELELDLIREEKRKGRDKLVKGKIKETNYGGREMEIHKYRLLKEKTEKEEKERMEKLERKEFRKQAELQK